MKRASLLIATVGMAALALTGCGGNDSDTAATTTTSAASTTKATTQAAPLDMSKLPQLPAVPGPASATVDCTYPQDTTPAKPVDAPNATGVPAEGTVAVALTTNVGPIGMELNRTAAPCTVNSIVNLVEQKYLDDTPCHRLSTMPGLQILQCGDPTGKGTGGPGYRFANEYPTTAYAENDPALSSPVVYPRGTLAMAHSSQPDSNGSQFFLVYADSILSPDYTVFGTIDEAGLATIEKVAEAGDDGSMSAGGGAPNTPVTIETAVVA